MFNYFRRNKGATADTPPSEAPAQTANQGANQEVPQDTDKIITKASSSDTATRPSFFARLKSGLSKTREKLSLGLTTLLLGKKSIDADLEEALESQLLSADVGIEATNTIMSRLKERVARSETEDSEALLEHLKSVLE